MQTEDPLATLTELYQKRHPIYESLADIVIRTGAGHVTRVVADIIEQLTRKLSELQNQDALAPAEATGELNTNI